MAKKRPESEDDDIIRTRDQAVQRYAQLGKELYGIGVDPRGIPANKRDVRRKLRYDRRMLEGTYPDIRQLEKDTYRTGSTHRDAYIPKLFVVYNGLGGGSLTYPDGSREQHAEYYFINKNGLMRIFAMLAFYDKISPTATEVIVAGSALPMATFLEELV